MTVNRNFIVEMSKEPSLLLNLIIGASDEIFINIVQCLLEKAYYESEYEIKDIVNSSIEIYFFKSKVGLELTSYDSVINKYSNKFFKKIDILIYDGENINDRDTYYTLGTIENEELIFDINTDLINKIKNKLKLILTKTKNDESTS
jgi:hypothetical protein